MKITIRQFFQVVSHKSDIVHVHFSIVGHRDTALFR